MSSHRSLAPGWTHALVRRLVTPLCLLLSSPAWAQTRPRPAGRTDPRPAEAKAACVAGEVQKGVRLLAEIYLATNDAIWIFNQGRCYQQNGQQEQALARFREYLRKATNGAPDDVKEAQRYVKELEAELTARRAPPPAAPVAEKQASRAMPGPTTESASPAAAVSAASPPPHRLTRLQVAGLTVAGVGVLALGAGGFFSYQVQATEKDVNDLARGESLVEAGTLKDRDRDGSRYELLQWISYAVGVGAVAVGATAFLLGRPGEEREDRVALSLSPVVGPGLVGSAVRGSF